MDPEILNDEEAELFIRNIYDYLDFFVTRYLNNKKDEFDDDFLKIKEERVKKNMCDKICTICIDKLRVNQKVKIPRCNHIFHRDCLHKWCKKKFTCPDCRQDMKKI